jgi:acid phosphatase family membrane protein YuiD
MAAMTSGTFFSFEIAEPIAANERREAKIMRVIVMRSVYWLRRKAVNFHRILAKLSQEFSLLIRKIPKYL